MPSTLPPSFTLLQVTPRLDGGGVERATLDLAAGVVRAGGRSLVASLGGAMEVELAAAGAQLVRLPVHRRNPATILLNTARLADTIRREDVTLVHVRSRAPAFSAIAAGRRTGVPVVATYHGIYGANSSLKRWYNGVMTRGDLVIANSNFTREHLLAQHSPPVDRVAVVPEGLDTARFDPLAVDRGRVEAIRTAWGLTPDDGRRVLLCAARLTAWKGQGTAIRAFAARPRRDNAILILAGREESATYAAALRTLADGLGIGGSVKIVGQVDDMPAAMLAADVILAPSNAAESFGRSVVEAMAMGRPVVASAIGAHLETVIDGETGWLVPPTDTAAWVRAIDAAIAMPMAPQTSMGQAARLRAVSMYSLEAMIEATFTAYRSFLERR